MNQVLATQADMPTAVMGTIYVGGMQLRYDVSGGTVLRFSNGLETYFLPDMGDATIFVQASALGYGRQVGCLVRDRILLHVPLAEVEGTEPWYLAGDVWEEVDHVDLLVMWLNQIRRPETPTGTDDLVLTMARTMLRGGGYDA